MPFRKAVQQKQLKIRRNGGGTEDLSWNLMKTLFWVVQQSAQVLHLSQVSDLV